MGGVCDPADSGAATGNDYRGIKQGSNTNYMANPQPSFPKQKGKGELITLNLDDQDDYDFTLKVGDTMNISASNNWQSGCEWNVEAPLGRTIVVIKKESDNPGGYAGLVDNFVMQLKAEEVGKCKLKMAYARPYDFRGLKKEELAKLKTLSFVVEPNV